MLKKNQKNTKKVHIFTLLLFLPIFFLLTLVSIFMPIVSGFAAFPFKTIQCGHQPYVADRLAGVNSYTIPGDSLYHGPNIFTKSDDLFCTEAAAQKVGLSPDTWSERCESSLKPRQSSRCTPGGDGFDSSFTLFAILIVTAGLLSYIVASKIESTSKHQIKSSLKK